MKDLKKNHNQLENIPNLQVIKAMQSLKSRSYVRENFTWRHHYWYLTNEGIQYLRDFLHLPPEIVPSTLRRATKPAETAKPFRGAGGAGRGDRGGDRGGDRDEYRRGQQPAEGDEEKGGSGRGFNPE